MMRRCHAIDMRRLEGDPPLMTKSSAEAFGRAWLETIGAGEDPGVHSTVEVTYLDVNVKPQKVTAEMSGGPREESHD